MIKNILLLLLVMLPALTYGQASSLRWTASTLTDLNTGEVTDTEDVITSYGTTTVTWRHNGVLKTYTIKEVDGTWANTGQPGSIIYEVDGEGTRGTITFQKNDQGIITVQFLLLNGDALPWQWELTIATLDIL